MEPPLHPDRPREACVSSSRPFDAHHRWRKGAPTGCVRRGAETWEAAENVDTRRGQIWRTHAIARTDRSETNRRFCRFCRAARPARRGRDPGRRRGTQAGGQDSWWYTRTHPMIHPPPSHATRMIAKARGTAAGRRRWVHRVVGGVLLDAGSHSRRRPGYRRNWPRSTPRACAPTLSTQTSSCSSSTSLRAPHQTLPRDGPREGLTSRKRGAAPPALPTGRLRYL